MDLNLKDYNVRDAMLRSLLSLANEFGIKHPEKEQQEKLADIADQLENRVQDELDAIEKRFRDGGTTVVEEESFMVMEVEGVEAHFDYEGEDIKHIVVNGAIYGKFCNEPVHHDNDTGVSTYCMKQWAHLNPEHEDSEGRLRL